MLGGDASMNHGARPTRLTVLSDGSAHPSTFSSWRLFLSAGFLAVEDVDAAPCQGCAGRSEASRSDLNADPVPGPVQLLPLLWLGDGSNACFPSCRGLCPALLPAVQTGDGSHACHDY